MCKLKINGNRPLYGEVHVQGSKNAVLPILSACLLTKSECIIHNCPIISDVYAALDIIKSLGGRACLIGNTAVVCADIISDGIIEQGLMQKMRSSVMFLGSILARNGEAQICRPGGCRLGERPIDIHIDSMKKFGASIDESGECIKCKLECIKGEKAVLLYPSVGATENIMLMCALSDSVCEIVNPAREPEIKDLQNFLNAMGADIRGAGSDRIIIRGVKKLNGCEYSVIPDRIAAATYLAAAAICGGEVAVKKVIPQHILTIIEVLERTGCKVKCSDESIVISKKRRQHAISNVKTLPYPGFPTDIQPIMAAYLSLADGTSVIKETIFDGRFGYVCELKKMAAEIECEENSIKINGVSRLRGNNVEAADLRGGAALVVAGLAAEGETTVTGVEYIDRGYEKIEQTLSLLGARIKRIY